MNSTLSLRIYVLILRTSYREYLMSLTTEEFETAFKSLKRNKAAGIDTINSNIIRDNCDEVKNYFIFNF